MSTYLEKKKLAEALRRKQAGTAALGLGGAFGSPLTTTPGVSGGGGVYSQPEQVSVNYAAPLAQLGAAWMGRRDEDKASAAEVEAEAARTAEMEAAMQAASQGGGTIDPQTAIKLQELGVDAATIKLMMPKAANVGAVTQAAKDPSGIRALVTTGVWTKEQGDEALAALAADRAAAAEAEKAQYKWEQENAYRAPVQPSEHDRKLALYRDDPAAYAAMYGDKAAEAAAKAAGKGGAASGRYDPAREAQVLAETAATLRSTIETNGDEMFGLPQTGLAVLRKTGSEKPGSLFGNVLEAVGTKGESPANAVMRSTAIDATLEQIAKMAPASDTDVRTLLANRANAFQSKESALEFIALMEKVAARYQGGAGLAAPGGGSIDSEIDALMAQ